MNAKEARDYAMKQGLRYEKIQDQIRFIDKGILTACTNGLVSFYIQLDILPETVLHFKELGYTIVVDNLDPKVL